MTIDISGDTTGASFPSLVVAPSDGDSDRPASVSVPLTSLADRTHWLYRSPSLAVRKWTYHGGRTRTGAGPFTPAAIASGRFSAASPYETWMVVGDYASGTGTSYSTAGPRASWAPTGISETDDLVTTVYDPVNERWVICGEMGALYSAAAANGSWDDRSISTGDWFLCADVSAAGRIVAAGNAIANGSTGMFARRSDDGGDSWSELTAFPVFSGVANQCRCIAAGPDGWAAGGETTTNATALWSSVDGDTFVLDDVPAGVTGEVMGMCASGPYFIAVTADGEILRKAGGVWSAIEHGLPGTLDFTPGVAADPVGTGVLVAVSSVGSPVVVSLDHGATWVRLPDEIDADFAPTAVMCSGTQWVIAGTGTEFDIATSMVMG